MTSNNNASATFCSIKVKDFCAYKWVIPDPQDPTKLILHGNVCSRAYKDKGGKWSVQLTRTDLPETQGGEAIPITRTLPYKLKFDVKGDKDAEYNKEKKYDTSVGVALVVNDQAMLATLNELREAHIIAALKHRKEIVPDTTSDEELARRIRVNFGWHDHEPSSTTKQQRAQLKNDRKRVIESCPVDYYPGYLALKIHEKNLEMPTSSVAPDFKLKPDIFVDMRAAVKDGVNVSVTKEVLHEGSLMAADICLLGVSVQETNGFARWKIFGGLVKDGKRSVLTGAAALDDNDKADLAAYCVDDDEAEARDDPGLPTTDMGGGDEPPNKKRKLDDAMPDAPPQHALNVQ